MNKRMVITALLGVSMVTGCASGEHEVAPHTAEDNVTLIDTRVNDPSLLLGDTLFRRGDLGLEPEEGEGLRALTAGRVRQVWPTPELAVHRPTAIDNVIATASSYFSTPYEFGSDRSDPSTFDCSDFTRWIYLYTLGMDLPKDSRSQAEYVRRYGARTYTDFTAARPGDLLFFSSYQGIRPENYVNTGERIITHVGMYIGNGRMIHTASARTGGVRIDPVAGTHFEYRFVVGGPVLE